LGLSMNGIHTIKGEVLNVEPGSEMIGKGDRIKAKVNAARHALSIRQAE
jgi:hypothetical protein